MRKSESVRTKKFRNPRNVLYCKYWYWVLLFQAALTAAKRHFANNEGRRELFEERKGQPLYAF
jgi:hypothetical protein